MAKTNQQPEVPSPLPDPMTKRLKALGWGRRVGRKCGIWVCAETQRLYFIEDGRIVRSYACSTSAKGTGNRMNSNKTPEGWHSVRAKHGDGCPEGAVFRSRIWTGDVWVKGSITGEDLVLTRILRLSGLEDRKNRGGKVDTWKRMVYVHGTNAGTGLGQPLSKGCIRLSNRDAIDLFDRTPVGCRVLISRD